MANITEQNNLRYQIDTLRTTSYGVLYTTDDSVNLTRAETVKGISISGQQPTKTTRHIAFKLGGKWGKLSTSGTFSAFSVNSPTFDNISTNGNTPAELTALTNIPALAGQTFGVAFALSSEDTKTYGKPSCSLSFNCYNNNQVFSAMEISPVYDLGTDGQIIKLSAETSTSNGGSVSVQARITTPEGPTTDWNVLDAFTGRKANAVQFRGNFTANSIGVSTAKIENVSCLYSDGSALMTGTSDGELFTVTQDWYMPVKQCRLTVKHAPLDDAMMEAYIVLRKSPKKVLRESLGVGSGTKKVYQLEHTDGIKYDSLKLYYNNSQVFNDYELNCQAGRLTCEAPEGTLVAVDYVYGWDTEEWQQMTLKSSLSFETYDQTEYIYSKPDDDTQERSVCALKLVLQARGGRITNEVVGMSTGTARSFYLTRRIRDGNITVTANGSTLAPKNWTLTDDPQYITVTAPYGQTIRATYDWISASPTVYEMYAVYAE